MSDDERLWYVTFGQRYHYEEHPRWAQAHPDGVLAIRATGYGEARRRTFELLGSRWSDLMDWEVWQRAWKLYPRGVVAVLERDSDVPVAPTARAAGEPAGADGASV